MQFFSEAWTMVGWLDVLVGLSEARRPTPRPRGLDPIAPIEVAEPGPPGPWCTVDLQPPDERLSILPSRTR